MVTATQIKNILNNVKGTTLANITTKTPVKTAAAHKGLSITKTTTANVTLANNLNDFTSVYRNKVEREVGKPFVLSETYFFHTSCFSIVQHKTKSTQYLYAIYNQSHGTAFEIDGVAATRNEVAEYLTPSAREKLLNSNEPTYNAKNDVTHTVTVRTIKIENIVKFTACGQTL